jgi:hypothetical protein
MRLAFSKTFRCLVIAGNDISNGAATSPTEASPAVRRASIARRVGSDSAANVRSIEFAVAPAMIGYNNQTLINHLVNY